MVNLTLYPKTIEACDYCGCFDAVQMEEHKGEIIFVCDKCYPMFADWYHEDIKEDKPKKKFKWKEVT